MPRMLNADVAKRVFQDSFSKSEVLVGDVPIENVDQEQLHAVFDFSKMTKRKRNSLKIPPEILWPAYLTTKAHFGGRGADSWEDEEEKYCKDLCGEDWKHIRQSAFRTGSSSIRKWAHGRAKKMGLIKPRKNKDTKQKRKKELSPEYLAYLESIEWKGKRVQWLAFWGYQCCICNCKATEGNPIDVHHRTHERLKVVDGVMTGAELFQDCVVLCRTCHELYEDHKLSMKG